MKKTIFTLSLAIFSICAFSQSIPYDSIAKVGGQIFIITPSVAPRAIDSLKVNQDIKAIKVYIDALQLQRDNLVILIRDAKGRLEAYKKAKQ